MMRSERKSLLIVSNLIFKSRTHTLSSFAESLTRLAQRSRRTFRILSCEICSAMYSTPYTKHDAKTAEKWHAEKKISNEDVRHELGKHPMGEVEGEMKNLYKFFCLGTHPNRGLIARRFLGEGNEFVLGRHGTV